MELDNKVIIAILIIGAIVLYYNYNSESLENTDKTYPRNRDKALALSQGASQLTIPTLSPNTQNSNLIQYPGRSVMPPSNAVNEDYGAVQLPNTNLVDKIVNGAPQLTAEDLLPKYDEASDFAKENPVSNILKEQNFLVSGYHMGINTTMQSNKIHYHDLRSAPPIPKQNVGPWNQSSYESFAGSNARKYFEIGAA
jgi:hypothetical protein